MQDKNFKILCEQCGMTDSEILYPPSKQILLLQVIAQADFIDSVEMHYKEPEQKWVVSAETITEFSSEEPEYYQNVQTYLSDAIAGLTVLLISAGYIDIKEVKEVIKE